MEMRNPENQFASEGYPWDSVEGDRVDEIVDRHHNAYRRSQMCVLTRDLVRDYLFKDRPAGNYRYWGSVVHFRFVELGGESLEFFVGSPTVPGFRKVVREHIAKYFPGEKVKVIRVIDLTTIGKKRLHAWIDSFWTDTLRLPESLNNRVTFIQSVPVEQMHIELEAELGALRRSR